MAGHTISHAGSIALLWALMGATAYGGVTIDGTLRPGSAATLAGPNFQINAAHGEQRGGNLFHSFGQFSIAAGQSATFSGPAGISNIIGRVTGVGEPGGLARSDIHGSIVSSIAGANLFLINPAGFLFGPTATLDISGSFHASSAGYLRLADNTLFHALSPGSAATLTAAAPAAFGFLGAAGAIAVDRARLAVPAGRTITLAGGDVTVQEGNSPAMSAPGGRIDVASVAAAGEATLGAGGIDLSGIASRGAITLLGNPATPGNATLDVTHSAGGGSIAIRGGRIVMTDAKLRGKTVGGNAGRIDIEGVGDVSIAGGEIVAVTTGAGNAGTIAISGNNVTISGGTLVDTSCDPGCTSGTGGPLAISAAQRILITGGSAVATGVVSNTFGGGASGAITVAAPAVDLDGAVLVQSVTAASGPASGVTLNAARLAITNGAQVDASAYSSGVGGSVDARATGTLTIDGGRIDPGTQQRVPSGLFANTLGPAAGGAIRVNAGQLRVTGGGEISTSSNVGASGDGGAIAITSTGPVLVSGTDGAGKSSAIVANTFSAGRAGRIGLTAPLLEVSNDGRIQAQSQGAGAASDIVLELGGLLLSGRGQISSDARSSGAGGTILATVSGTASITGFDSGLFAKAYTLGAGGSVILNADTLALSERGGLFAGTDGIGAGGNIRVVTRSSTSLASGSSIASRSSLDSPLAGTAGEIFIDAGKSLQMVDSSITTQAAQADGGNIVIKAVNLVSLLRSSIATAVGTGLGSGGNINIDPDFLVLNQSSIIANAFGGSGGNIDIVAGQFLRSPDSVVDASSALGVSGTIVISSPPVDVSGTLAAPPVAYLDASALLTNPCAARLAGRASSLVLASRGGVPYSGEGYVPLFALEQYPAPPAAQGARHFAQVGGLGVPIARCASD